MDPNQGNNPDPNNPPADDTGAPVGSGTPTGDAGNQTWTPPAAPATGDVPPVSGPEPVAPEPQAPETTPTPAAETPTEENNGGAPA